MVYKREVNLGRIHSKDVLMNLAHEVFGDMYLRMGEICEEYYWKLVSLHNQQRIIPNDCDDVNELDVSILVGGYEDKQNAHKVFDKMSPPKFDSYLSHEENELMGILPNYQDDMNVDQIFDYFTIMDEVLSCNNQEKEEYNPLCSIFDEVVNGSKVKDFGVPRYDIELENSMLEASQEQFQVCEPTTGSKHSLKLQQNGEEMYMNPIWAFIEDKFHGCSLRARLREMLGVSLLLGGALNYVHKMLNLVSNYNGRCRGRIVFKRGRSSSTNGEYALKNSWTNLFKQREDGVFINEEILGVSLVLGDALNYDHKVLHLVSNYNGRCRGRIVFKQGRNSSTNGEYALKNSRTNLFKEGEDDALWMLPTTSKDHLCPISISFPKYQICP